MGPVTPGLEAKEAQGGLLQAQSKGVATGGL